MTSPALVPPTLHSTRLLLRPLQDSDAADIARIAGTREVADTTVSVPHPLSLAAAREWIATDLGVPGPHQRVYAVTETSTGKVLGLVALKHIEIEHGQAELSFWIDPAQWGNGYAREAAQRLVTYAFGPAGLRRLIAYHMVRNPASGKVLASLGFLQEGLLRQRIIKWGVVEDVCACALLASAQRVDAPVGLITLGDMQTRGRLFVIAAPSGTGKTSLVKALMQRKPSLKFSVSYTTRKPRTAEVDGQDYHFVSKETFQQMIAAGEFLEHAQVFDNFYGTGVRSVTEALERGQDLLLEIDWQGAQQVRKRLPECCSIFILPPSRAALEERLRARSTDTDAVIERRLRESVTELSHWNEFDHIVVNDRFEHALEGLDAIVAGRPVVSSPTTPEITALATTLLA